MTLRRCCLFLLLLLTACAPAVTPAPAATPTKFSDPRCAALQVPPTPDTRSSDLIPAPGKAPDEHSEGPAAAPVTILEYGDYTCPSCASLAAALRRLRQEYPEGLRVVYRHFPGADAKAAQAAIAAEAAARQDKFWQMHDQLYAAQADWQAKSPAEFESWLIQQAMSLGLDPSRFRADLQSAALKTLVEDAQKRGAAIGLPGTPILLINGQIYGGPQDYVSLQFSVGMLTLAQRQFKTCPPVVIDVTKNYYATLKLAGGVVRLKLYADKTPFTVNNFVFLAQNGWYNHVPIHRVVPGLMIQSGDPSGTGGGNPGYFIGDEIFPALTYDRAGLLGMVNSGPGTNGSQFFITLGPAPQFNGGYTLFGEVVSGLELLQALPARAVQFGQSPPAAEVIESVEVSGQ
ncbi:MAG: hypothetical protein Fur0035_17410 [Anaerolineales bacterium]